MSQHQVVSRRRYLKYGAAGIAAVTFAGVGGYYLSRPRPGPIQVTQTGTTSVSTSLAAITKQPYRRQVMPDFWRGFWAGPGGGMTDDMKVPYAGVLFDVLKRRMNSPEISIYNQFWTTTSESADVHEIEGNQPGGAGDHYPRPVLQQVIEVAHQCGLKVAYWPYLGPRSHGDLPGWEGALRPTPQVFEAYRKHKAEEARIAEETQCEMFWLGGEWNKGYTYKRGREFKRVLEDVRSNYSGSLLVEFLFCDEHAAKEVINQIDPDNFELIDYVGLSMLLYPMSKDLSGTLPSDRLDIDEKFDPDVPTMVTRIQRMGNLADKAADRYGKPVIFTELEAYSFDGASLVNPRFQPDAFGRQVDYQEQADMVEAIMRMISQIKACKGVSWNCWANGDPMSLQERKSNVYQTKPSEKVLKFWYSKKNIHDGVGLLLTPDGHVDLDNLKREKPLNENGQPEITVS